MAILWLAGALVFGAFLAEGLITGRIVALPIRFDRQRQTGGFWFVAVVYAIAASGFAVAALSA